MRVIQYKRAHNKYGVSKRWSRVEFERPFAVRIDHTNYKQTCRRAEMEQFARWLYKYLGKTIKIPD